MNVESVNIDLMLQCNHASIGIYGLYDIHDIHGIHDSRHRIIVLQNPVRRPFEIIELSAAERPPEHPADEKHQHDRKWYQKIEDVHRKFRREAR